MKLELTRKNRTELSTIGDLSIDGVFFCHTLEDKDRGLNSNMPLPDIMKVKVKGETCIPTGTYKIIYVWSDKHQRKLWLLVGVKGFVGIEIHIGNYPKDTLGCLLLGNGIGTDRITESTIAFNKFMALLPTTETHEITIK